MSEKVPDRFEVERELGTGSLGKVLLAADGLRGGKKVALKIIDIKALGDAGLKTLAGEFSLLRKLDHPGLAAAVDFIVDAPAGRAYMAQEFIDGPDFFSASRGKSSETVFKWGLAIAKTLTYLHGHGVVHGDLKPENVIVSPGGPVLIDFGLAAPSGVEAEGLRGTPAYMAPEMLRGAAPSPRSDLYALGVMLYRCLSGGLPYEAQNLADLLNKILAERPVSLREAVPKMATARADVIDKLIEKDPTKRYQTAVGLARDMAGLVGEAFEGNAYVPTLLPLVGRDVEVEALKRWIDEYASNSGSAVIRGAKGMGASRLLREAADYARTRGMNVAEIEVRRDLPLTESLIELAQTPAGGKIDLPHADKDEDDRSAQRRKYALWQSIGDRLASAGDLLIAVDNFEEAGESAVELLRYMVSRFGAEKGPLFLAAESDSAKPVPWALEIKPAPLDKSAVAGFAAEVWGEEPSTETAEKLARASGGNPLFLREILKNIEPGSDPDKGAIPQSLEKMFTASIGMLEPENVRTMEALAVWGGPAESDVPAYLLDADAGDVYSRLRELEEKGLVTRRDGRFEPSAPMLAALVEDSMAAGPRRNLHEKAARLLMERADAPPEAVARHLLRAGNSDKGTEWTIRAGERLRSIGAHGEAAALYKQALEIAGESDSRRNALLEGMGISAATAGLFSESLAAWRERIERAEGESPVLRASFHLEMARCQQRKGEYDRAERAISRAEEEIGNEPSAQSAERYRLEALEARALVNLAGGRYEEAAKVAGKGIALAGESADAAAPFLSAAGLAHTYTGDYDSAVEYFEKALGIFKRTGDMPRQVLALSSLGVALQHRGDGGAALKKYMEAFDLAGETGDLRARTTLAMNIASVHHQGGDYGKAVAGYRQALTLAMQVGAEADAARVENNLGNLLIYLGRPGEAREFIERSIKTSKRLKLRYIEGYNHLLRGDILKGRGEMMGARKEYLRARRRLASLGAARESVQVDLRLASLYSDMGEMERAMSSAREAYEASRRLNLRSFEAESQLVFSKIAMKAGRKDDALSHAGAAMALAEGEAGPGLMWEIHAAMGSAMMKLGREKDARPHLEKAYETALSLRDALPAEYRDGFLSGPAWDALSEEMSRLRVEGQTEEGLGQRWEKLLEVNRQLNLEHDLTRLLELIMDSVLVLVKAERGFLILNRDGRLEVPVARNIDKESVGRAKDKISRSIAEEVFRSGSPLITVDAQQDERFGRFVSVHELKLRSVLCIPFRVKDRVVGSLYVDNRFQTGAFRQEDLRVMEAFADQAAIAIENARLIEENEKKRLRLEASHKRIQALVDELEQKVDRQNVEIAVLQRDLDRVPAGPTKYDYAHIVGQSCSMREVFALVDRVTDSQIPVLVEGESGTGKELVARAIHFNGPRKARSFLSENCSAIPETLLESELFGHEKGAFTGATERKIGLFEAADGGTIFLDEIGDMSLNMQAKLLRVLQDGEIRRVGSEKAMHVDVRVISATHQRLEDLISEGRFREDLYWRLNVVKIVMPPLRDRLEDVPLLFEHFAHLLQEEIGKPVTVSPEALRLMMAYEWPGNVRELENEIKKSALMSEGVIKSEGLSPRIVLAAKNAAVSKGLSQLLDHDSSAGNTLSAAVDEFERRHIGRVLQECGQNRAKAAKKLGIARRTLYDKLTKYGLDRDNE